NSRSLSSPALFTNHPLLYVRPAIEELDTSFLTGIQKSNDLDVHERHSVEVQHNPSRSVPPWRSSTIRDGAPSSCVFNSSRCFDWSRPLTRIIVLSLSVSFSIRIVMCNSWRSRWQ